MVKHLINYILYILLITLTPNLISKNSNFQQDSSFNISNQSLSNKDKTESFLRQPRYSKDSVKDFLTEVYNDTQYINILSFNLQHINTFLSFNNQSPLPRLYLKTVLKLFSQKLKSSPGINSYAYLHFLGEIPTYFKDICNENIETNNDILKKNKIKETLYTFFLNDFSELKKDPEKSLDKLAENLYYLSSEKYNVDQDITISELQQAAIQFLDVSISKLVWSPEDSQNIWMSVKNISQILEKLFKDNVISTTESLNDLYWTLISRFAYFLDICATDLKDDFFALTNQDIKNNSDKLLLFTLDEIDPLITNKAKFLEKSIFEAQARSLAYKAGLITDIIPPAIQLK